jgi:lipoyl(octanoyl) transferase
MSSPPPGPPLEIFLLGEVPLDDAVSLQRRLVYDQGEDPGGALILCEHPHAISVGRSGSRSHIAADDDGLREWGLSVRWLNRGGGCILHGPGQLAGYLVLSLDRLAMDLGSYLSSLHGVLLDLLAEFDLTGRTTNERTGIFLNRSRVASVGVAYGRGVVSHGFVLNVSPYLAPFALLDEPGLDGWPLRQTSMQAQRQRPTPMAKVREAVIRHVESRFGLARHHIYTDHPLIRSKARPHAYVASLG